VTPGTATPGTATPGLLPAGALGRVVRRAAGRDADAATRCELCAAPVARAHRHVLDERGDELLCACRACALLFESEAAGRGHYRLVPDRRIRLDGLSPADLGVPVSLVFFVRAAAGGAVLAHYPSPAGATRAEVDPAAWERAARRCEPLRSIRPAVEAVLINTIRGNDERWLVPVDECYRLVGIVRRDWRGLSGGRQVWPEIDRFFRELATRERG
jgi:uncharacterized protein DUF5947